MSETFFTLKIPVMCNVPFDPYLVTVGRDAEVERALASDPKSPDFKL